MLHPDNVDKETLIKKEVKNIVMAFSAKRNDLVEVVAGELKGCYGLVKDITKLTLKIQCKNK